jgi:LuxR family maltose regulon positive regulatory protein
VVVVPDPADRQEIFPIIGAKICGERLPGHAIDRPRLIELLDETSWRIAAVIAGPGTGKSVLVQQWLARLPENQRAVLALDEGDDHLDRFWRYLVAAIQRARPTGFRQSARLCREAPDRTELLIASLLEDASALDDPIVLVIEDVHTVRDTSILTALAALVERLPEQMRIVLTSRQDVALPVARWRARSWLIDVRGVDLAFNVAEAAQLFNALGHHDLDADDLLRIVTETEGWVTALQLLSIAMRRSDAHDVVAQFSGRTRIIADFLGSEVIDGQSEDVRDFMMAVSIADDFDPELCDALTGRTDSAEVLRALEANTHFLVAIDDDTRSRYRFHHLLRDVLRAELLRRSPERATRLHGLAAELLASRRDVAGAVRHLVTAGDYDGSFDLALEAAHQYWERGNVEGIAVALDLFPVDVVDRSRHRMVVYALALGLCGRFDEAFVWLERVRTFRSEPEERAEDAAWTDLLRLLALSVDGSDEEGIACGQRALEYSESNANLGPLRGGARENLARAYLLAGDPHRARATLGATRGTSTTTHVVSLGLSARISQREGRLGAATECAQRAMTAARSLGVPNQFVTIDAHLATVGVLLDRNELPGVAAHLADIHNILNRFPSMTYRVLTALEEAQLATVREGVDAGLARLGCARDEIEGRDRPGLRRLLDAAETRLRLDTGEVHAVPTLLARLSPSAEHDLLQARLLLAEGRLVDTRAVLDAVTISNARDRLGAALLRLRAAVVEGADVEPALTAVVELASPERFVRAILDEGPVIARLIRRCAERLGTIEAERLAVELGAPPRRHASAAPALVVALSERERDVLRFLPSRLTTKEIAAECFMSVNTVKAHLKRIYGKLGVTTRADAIERARMLGELHIESARTG